MYITWPRVAAMIVILSDPLHFDSSRVVLVTTLTSLLAKSADAQVHVSEGKYTAPNIYNF